MKSELIERLTVFGSKVIELAKSFGKEIFLQSIKNQLIKSATSIGANYQEAQFASSKPDFINKLHIAVKELAETHYWLNLIDKSNLIKNQTEFLRQLMQESEELRKILTSSILTAKNNLKQGK